MGSAVDFFLTQLIQYDTHYPSQGIFPLYINSPVSAPLARPHNTVTIYGLWQFFTYAVIRNDLATDKQSKILGVLARQSSRIHRPMLEVPLCFLTIEKPKGARYQRQVSRECQRITQRRRSWKPFPPPGSLEQLNRPETASRTYLIIVSGFPRDLAGVISSSFGGNHRRESGGVWPQIRCQSTVAIAIVLYIPL